MYNSRLNQSVTREYGDRSSPARETDERRERVVVDDNQTK